TDMLNEREIESCYLGQFIPVHYHHNMLMDQNRMHGFKSAIEQLERLLAAATDETRAALRNAHTHLATARSAAAAARPDRATGRGLTGYVVPAPDATAEFHEAFLEAANRYLDMVDPKIVMALPTDLGDRESMPRLLAAVGERFDAVDVLVNNAGVTGPAGPLWETD
ncbi:SDR family NAD(P)-dependent oxidoreductase, partial [Vreelandella neptunia]|uniref:SDR family NAD(P)-dependent oxidoreductase n=1 Tax=Vreelandella neptunia TaxID=115551 RepID=UPI0025B32261